MSKGLPWLVLGLSLLTVPVLAEQSNFNALTLAKGFDQSKAFVTGYTGGSFSLSSLAKLDSQNRPCIGYGGSNPDHLLILKNDFSNLKLAVESGGQNTTLVVRKNSKILRCSIGNNLTKDAQIQGENWSSGEYEVWVGSVEAGKRISYRLEAKSTD